MGVPNIYVDIKVILMCFWGIELKLLKLFQCGLNLIENTILK